jgi:hypothetical protein
MQETTGGDHQIAVAIRCSKICNIKELPKYPAWLLPRTYQLLGQIFAQLLPLAAPEAIKEQNAR